MTQLIDWALAPTWTQEANRRVTPTAAVFDGRSALQLESTGSWLLAPEPDRRFAAADLSRAGQDHLRRYRTPPTLKPAGSSLAAFDPQTTGQVFSGQTSLAIEAQKKAIAVDFFTWSPEKTAFGYALHFAFHPGQLEALDKLAELRVIVEGLQSTWIELLPTAAAPENALINLAEPSWQTVEIPLGDDPMASITFRGNLAGTFYLDDIRLIPVEPPAPANTAVLENQQDSTPTAFALDQNSPNPFNSGTVIRFALPQSAEVELTVFNLVGQKVATLVSGPRPPGTYQIQWDGRDDQERSLASGLYLYRLQVGPVRDPQAPALAIRILLKDISG